MAGTTRNGSLRGETVRCLQRRHLYVGRSASHLKLGHSFLANAFREQDHGREECIAMFEDHVRSRPEKFNRLGELGDRTLLCHCKLTQHCHSDALFRLFRDEFLHSGDELGPPAAAALQLAALRRQLVDDEGYETDADEGAKPAGSGWVGLGPPIQVGAGRSQRGLVGGGGLAVGSPASVDCRTAHLS